MRVLLRSIALTAIASAGVFAAAQDRKAFDYIALEVGAYYPTSGRLRDAFDSPVLRIGISPMQVRRAPDWRLSYELGFIGAKDGDDRFSIYPLTVGMQKSFGDPNADTAPYVRAGAGLAYFDYDIDFGLDEEDDSGIGAATAFEGGILVGDRFKASVRYYLFPEQSGINFSGFLISASYGLFKL